MLYGVKSCVGLGEEILKQLSFTLDVFFRFLGGKSNFLQQAPWHMLITKENKTVIWLIRFHLISSGKGWQPTPCYRALMIPLHIRWNHHWWFIMAMSSGSINVNKVKVKVLASGFLKTDFKKFNVVTLFQDDRDSFFTIPKCLVEKSKNLFRSFHLFLLVFMSNTLFHWFSFCNNPLTR